MNARELHRLAARFLFSFAHVEALPELHEAVFVGAVEDGRVRLLVRAPGAETLEVELLEKAGDVRTVARARLAARPRPDADGTWVFTLPDDVPGVPPPEPDRSYVVRVFTGTRRIGEGRFHTPWRGGSYPAAGRLRFGIASCHQPFDAHGRVRPESHHMLEAAGHALREADARFMLLMGDQIYADYPPPLSLHAKRFFERVAPPGRSSIEECTREEVRRLYQDRHRVFFGVEPFAQLQAICPTYPILDDHDVRDNFGTSPLHASEAWRAVREGALDAFYDYQAARVFGAPQRPETFHYGFTYGPAAVYVADLRAARVADADTVRVLDDAQVEALRAFMKANAELPFLCIVVTVPIVHIGGIMAAVIGGLTGKGGNAADRWSHPRMLDERDRFLRVLREHQLAHPHQHVLLLSGDIHVGSAFRLDWSDGGPPTYQFTSSALSHVQRQPKRWASEVLPRTSRRLYVVDGPSADVRRIPGRGPADRNPYGGVNVGLVELTWGGETAARFELVGTDEDGSPATVYRSEAV